ncbi:TPA_exp: Uncharacterized protein A8136_5458 [Trichophyton benhamiae CBS 112371]|uniref:Uncharacterized protein n=1 Tax=Arthroderma benhamiae (strain ATCC MYA-4681 / CBS 112371) TaxID=663331 RepID=D4B5C0_ARTBC|nr:uncharacterized protein ARB_03660 [Trichophyton benhamiae CBS 112371]EFE29453.1 conserved hypothetical protein [Trichophyton benhamiae CBS 112371]DAA72732.1 TPA_exp: Uncharacterized protein A8136_5458 [Trichophyton benhamiae CBS 112371]
MNPYMSWAILLLTAGGLGYYYKNNGSTAKSRPASLKPSERQESGPAGSKKEKAKQRTKQRRSPQPETNSSRNHSSEASNGVNAPAAVPETKKEQRAVEAEESISTSNGGMDDNYEFAKQFSKARNGTPLAAKPKPSTSKKPKKQATQQETQQQEQQPQTNGDSHVNHVSTAASSTTGADADDDMSPINSPRVKPAGDVTDMLEEPAPAASVLRLTGDMEDVQQGKKKKQQNNFKSVETKKQRQARRKREEKNEMVKQAEKARRAMVENQMHTAREYERQQAKSTVSPPSANAWASSSNLTPTTNGNTTGNGTSTKPSSAMPLLDTFEPAPAQPTPTQAGGERKQWTKDLPSEEEQMRMLNSLSSENEWTTVSNRKKEKRSKGMAESTSEASSSEAHANPIETSW